MSNGITSHVFTQANLDRMLGNSTPRPTASDVLTAPAAQLLSETEIAALADVSGLSEVSAEALLESSATRLADLDGQITGMFGVMDARRANSDVLGTRMAQLQMIQTALNSAGRVGNEKIKLENLTIETPDGKMNALTFIQRNGLAEVLQLADIGPKTEIGPQVQSAIDLTRTEQSQLNGRSEQDMMQLQQLVQQRGQVIELTTKLLDAIHQAQKAILANLGR